MTVRAKMKCISIEGDLVKFECSYDSTNTPEDNSFSKWTPSGHASYNISNPNAMEQFIVGEFYYFDMIPVNSPVNQEADND